MKSISPPSFKLESRGSSQSSGFYPCARMCARESDNHRGHHPRPEQEILQPGASAATMHKTSPVGQRKASDLEDRRKTTRQLRNGFQFNNLSQAMPNGSYRTERDQLPWR